jgi:hypothetical protein
VLASKRLSIVHTANSFRWCDDSDYIAVSRSKHARPSVNDVNGDTFRFLMRAATDFIIKKPWVSGRRRNTQPNTKCYALQENIKVGLSSL